MSLPVISGAEVALEQAALLTFEAAYGLFFNLAYTLAGEVELGADFLESHLLASDAEEHLQDFALALVELTERALHFVRQGFLVESGVGHGAVIVGEHVEKAVVLAFDKRSVYRYVAARNLEGVGYFFNGHVERFGQLLGRGAAFVFLLEFRECLADFIQ